MNDMRHLLATLMLTASMPLLSADIAAAPSADIAAAPSATADVDNVLSWPVPAAPIEEMTYTPDSTRFCLWSPKADSVQVILYEAPSPLPTSPKGEELGISGTAGNSGISRLSGTAGTATVPCGSPQGKVPPVPSAPQGNPDRQALSLSPQPDGTWTATVKGRDLKGTYYTFRVKACGKWLSETPGIFAKAVSLNGQRAYITDLRTTNPIG